MRILGPIVFVVFTVFSMAVQADDWEVVYPWEGQSFSFGTKQIGIYVTKPLSEKATIVLTVPGSSKPISFPLPASAGTHYVATITKEGTNLDFGDYTLRFKEGIKPKGRTRNFEVAEGSPHSFSYPTIEYPQTGQQFPKHVPKIALGGTTDSAGFYYIKEPDGSVVTGKVSIVNTYSSGLKHWRNTQRKPGTFWDVGKYQVKTFSSRLAYRQRSNPQEESYYWVIDSTAWPKTLQFLGKFD